MCRKITFFMLFCVFTSVTLVAQPSPCIQPATMTSVCADACIICDIDGFQGRHESIIVGESPPGFAGECTFVAHNMQWIAFIAGSTNLSVSLTVSNCDLNNGLEFGLYKGDDCTNYERISNCFGGVTGIIGPGQSGTINNTEPLIIGQYYYIVMDGGLGDNCDWTFEVISGSTSVAPLTLTGVINGVSTTCPQVSQIYNIAAVPGATIYEWTVNNMPVGNNTDITLDYIFPADGSYQICVTAKNACDEALPACQTVTVISLPTVVINDFFCSGDAYDVAGQQITTPGFHQFTIPSAIGCDSTIDLTLDEIITPITNIDIDICEGDTLFVGDAPYFATGLGTEILQSGFLCDSIVNIDLFVVVCNIEGVYTSDDVSCTGLSDGDIDFRVVNGTAPFTYNWEELGTSDTGSGMITAVGQFINIPNLSAGTYTITISDNFMNVEIIIAEVFQPDPIAVDFKPTNFNGFGVSCFGGMDGEIKTLVTGGNGNYIYNWQDGTAIDSIILRGAGTYYLTITDDRSCEVIDSIELTEPTAINSFVSFIDPGCDGEFTGMTLVNSTTGGVGPYMYSRIEGDYQDDTIFTQLTTGQQDLWVRDANNCTTNYSGILTASDIPNIQLEDDLTVNLGCSYDISTTINDTDLFETIWTSIETLSCDDCLEPSVTPLNSDTYTLRVTSVDGCTDEESIYIEVDKEQRFFPPTAFSPNNDGINDVFAIHGGKSVVSYDLFIFDRWGNPVYQETDLDPFNPDDGWDGTLKGAGLNPGVYAWVATLTFLDGETLTPSGSLTLMR